MLLRAYVYMYIRVRGSGISAMGRGSNLSFARGNSKSGARVVHHGNGLAELVCIHVEKCV